MVLITRIIGLSLITAGLFAALGAALFWRYPDGGFPMILIGCVGGIIGAIAGVGREIVVALHRKSPATHI